MAVSRQAVLAPAWAPTRLGGFVLLVALSVGAFWQPLATVLGRSWKYGGYEHYSHIILLPFFSAYLLYLNREAILQSARRGLVSGTALMAAGAGMAWLAGTAPITASPDSRLSLAMLGLVTVWVGAFALCYGPRALRIAGFPLGLLFFMVPFPPRVLAAVIAFLQYASADASAVAFRLIGMPVFRKSPLAFELPGLTILVAEECSGIRSSLALLISGLVLAYLMLRTTWARAALVAVIIPLTIVKNAFRIALLSWLAVYVDRSFITGSFLHQSGGIPLFVLSLGVLGGLALLLRRCEARRAGPSA